MGLLRFRLLSAGVCCIARLQGSDLCVCIQVDLQRSIEVWHAVETSKTTFVVCHAHGISEVDVDGRVTRVCQYDQFLHPCHLTVINGTLCNCMITVHKSYLKWRSVKNC